MPSPADKFDNADVFEVYGIGKQLGIPTNMAEEAKLQIALALDCLRRFPIAISGEHRVKHWKKTIELARLVIKSSPNESDQTAAFGELSYHIRTEPKPGGPKKDTAKDYRRWKPSIDAARNEAKRNKITRGRATAKMIKGRILSDLGENHSESKINRVIKAEEIKVNQ